MSHKTETSFHPREAVAAGLARIFGEVIERALAEVEGPTANRTEGIHEIRISIKRLRALLLLIRPAVSDESYRRENARLRYAGRLLAGSRDAAIARKTLLKLAKTAAGRRERDAFTKVLKGFRATFEPPADSDQGAALRAVARALRQSHKKISRLKISAGEWPAIGPGLKAVYRAGRKRMERAFAGNDDADFHRWRIRAKGLFYELEWLAAIWPSRIGKFLGWLKKLQSKMGDDHDLVALKSLLESAPALFGGARAIERVLVCAERRSRKLRKAGRKLGAAIYDQRPRRFIGKLEKHWRKWRRPTASYAVNGSSHAGGPASVLTHPARPRVRRA